MTIYSMGLVGGFDSDVKMLDDNRPSVEFGEAYIEIVVQLENRAQWDRVSDALNAVLKQSGVDAHVDVTVSIPATRPEKVYRNYAIFPNTLRRLRKLRSVEGVLEPVPANPAWTITFGFTKCPTWDKLLSEAGKALRVVWSKSSRLEGEG